MGTYDGLDIWHTTVANFHRTLLKELQVFIVWWKVLLIRFTNIFFMLIFTVLQYDGLNQILFCFLCFSLLVEIRFHWCFD